MTKVFSRALLAAVLVSVLPGAALAQDGPTPEGATWHLAAYAADGETETVPWLVDATLLLQDGAATGSSGCNTFSGDYTIDGQALTFGEEFAVTRMACPEPQMSVEDAYLSLLPKAAGWDIEGDALTLSDSLGEPLLQYEQAVAVLTPSDLAAIAAQFDEQLAQIDRANERIDSIRIGTVRDRIKELESSVASLKAAAATSSRPGSGSAFNAAEKVLLKAIPQKVEKTCKSLRSGLPSGSAAAVVCDGSRKTVAEQAYYLMEWSDAVTALESVANSKGVPDRLPRCHNQRAGWIHYGTNLGAEACWSENGKANYRLITNATGCKQLDVAGTQLKNPAIYLAMEGVNDKMEPVRAAGLAYTDAGSLIMNFEAGGQIPAKGQPNSPGCKARMAAAPGL